MDDLEFRRRVLSGDTRSTDIQAAAATDSERQRWFKQAGALDAVLKERLQHTPPRGLVERLKQIPDQQKQRKRRMLSVAAGILLSLGLAAFLLLPKDTSLSAELVQHVADEPNSLYSRQALSPATIQLVAGRLGYRFNSPQTNISYAANCLVAGSQALHFTVQADHSSATLLLMPHQELNASHQFHQHHLHGRIVPLSRGSAAILSNDPAMLDQLEATTLQQLIF